jgi:hypothetical protein
MLFELATWKYESAPPRIEFAQKKNLPGPDRIADDQE